MNRKMVKKQNNLHLFILPQQGTINKQINNLKSSFLIQYFNIELVELNTRSMQKIFLGCPKCCNIFNIFVSQANKPPAVDKPSTFSISTD